MPEGRGRGGGGGEGDFNQLFAQREVAKGRVEAFQTSWVAKAHVSTSPVQGRVRQRERIIDGDRCQGEGMRV